MKFERARLVAQFARMGFDSVGIDAKYELWDRPPMALADAIAELRGEDFLGANVTIHHESALVRGVPKMRGAEVMATDLRASVSLVIAALAAEGETMVNRVYHLDRGFERLEDKLARCGAQIERVTS